MASFVAVNVGSSKICSRPHPLARLPEEERVLRVRRYRPPRFRRQFEVAAGIEPHLCATGPKSGRATRIFISRLPLAAGELVRIPGFPNLPGAGGGLTTVQILREEISRCVVWGCSPIDWHFFGIGVDLLWYRSTCFDCIVNCIVIAIISCEQSD